LRQVPDARSNLAHGSLCGSGSQKEGHKQEDWDLRHVAQ
jgi:hypothetical protein